LLSELGRDALVFTSVVVDEWGERRGEDLSQDQGWEIAQALDLSRDSFDQSFDGTPGSISLGLDQMRNRYRKLRTEDRGGVSMSRLLDSAKLLSEARQPNLFGTVLRTVAEEIRGATPLSPDVWEALQRRTQEEGFGRFDDDGRFQIYRPYIERCVLYRPSEEDLERLLPILAREDDDEGLFFLGTIYAEKGRYQQALVAYETAVGRSGTYLPLILSNKSAVLSLLGRAKEALEAAETALAFMPDLAEAWNNKGTALNSLGRLEEALEAVDRALSLNPDYPDAWTNKGSALLALGSPEEALRAQDRALTLKPMEPRHWSNKAHALLALRRFEEALEACDRSIYLRPDFPEAWTNKGQALFGLERLDEALEAHDKALSLKPDRPEAWLYKGSVLTALGSEAEEERRVTDRALKRYEEALEAYDQALYLRPNYPSAFESKGIVLARLNRHNEAAYWLLQAWQQREQLRDKGSLVAGLLRWLETATGSTTVVGIDKSDTSDDGDFDFVYNEGLKLAEQGQYEQALVAFDRAVTLRNDDPDAWDNKGTALSAMGRYQEALESYHHALRLSTSNPRTWFNVGVVLTNLHRDSEALDAYDEALSRQRDFPEAWNNKGSVLLRLGRYAEAVRACDEAINLRPDYAGALLNRGIALARLNQRDEAVTSLCQAWRAREQLPYTSTVLAVRTLADLGHKVEECD